MTTPFDPSSPGHAKALELLEEKQIGWLTTIGSDGAARAVPVWFLWHDGIASIVSEPETVKVENLQRDPRVLLHLETSPSGGDVVVLRGTTTLHPDSAATWMAEHRDAYVAKYERAIEEFGMPLEKIVETFSTVIEVHPEHLMTW